MLKKMICLSAVGLILALAGSAGAQEDPNLEAYWALDGDALDASGNERHGTLMDGGEFIEGIYGQALSLTGGNAYVNIDGYKGINAVDGVQQAFTIANWFRTTGNGEMVTWGTNTGGQRLSWRIDGGSLRTEHGSGNLRGNTSVNDGEWHHGALVVTEGANLQVPNTRLYVDGVEDTTFSGSDNTYNLTAGADVSIGRRADDASRYFPGDIDEVYIYSRVLEPAEIAALAMRPRAWSPNPSDGEVDVTLSLFEWKPSTGATMHNVYLGTTPELGEADFVGAQPITMYFHAPGLEPGATYYWRVDDVAPDGSIREGRVWSFTVQPVKAYDPMPWDGAKFQSVDVDLNWKAGQNADSHVVYFGTDQAAVEAGDESVLQSTQETTSFDPNTLELETTYYWRVDEINTAGETVVGDVVSFTTTLPGLGMAKREIWEGIGGTSVDDLLADPNFPKVPSWTDEVPDFKSPPFDPDMNDYGGRLTAWLHVPEAGEYTFWVAGDDNCRLYIGADQEDAVQIAEVPTWTGVDQWDKLPEQKSEPMMLEEGVYYLEALWKEGGGGDSCSAAWQGAGIPERTLITGGYLEPFVRLWASLPDPASGAEDVAQWLILDWWEGVQATERNLYVGTDKDAVMAATPDAFGIFQGRLSDTQFTLEDLQWGQTYYWRVDELNGAEVWPGNLWSFTTAADHIPVLPGMMTVDYNNVEDPNYVTEAVHAVEVPQDWTIKNLTSLELDVKGSFQVMQDGDSFKIYGAGADIWGSADEFRYVYKTLNGDGMIEALVTDNGEGSNAWAKGGVMIRQDLSGGALNAFTAVTGGNGNGGTFQWRPEADSGSSSSRTLEGIEPPYWVRLVREGSTFTGYMSADGVDWMQQGETSVDVNMVDPVLVGLAVTSHQSGELRRYDFDNVAITGDVSGDWMMADVGVSQGGNAPAPMYVGVQDTAGNVAVVPHPANPDAVRVDEWTTWKIPLSKFQGASLDDVAAVIIGVGDGQPGNIGSVDVRDIDVVQGFDIEVENASFEEPDNPNWGLNYRDEQVRLDWDLVPGWSIDSDTNMSYLEKNAATNGKWSAYLWAGKPGIWQVTDHTIVEGEIFEVKVDASLTSGPVRQGEKPLKVVLFYDMDGTRVPVASKKALVSNSKSTYSLTFNTADARDAVGYKLGVEISNVGDGNALNVDNVRLRVK